MHHKLTITAQVSEYYSTRISVSQEQQEVRIHSQLISSEEEDG